MIDVDDEQHRRQFPWKWKECVECHAWFKIGKKGRSNSQKLTCSTRCSKAYHNKRSIECARRFKAAHPGYYTRAALRDRAERKKATV
jgi:hypothetical protein